MLGMMDFKSEFALEQILKCVEEVARLREEYGYKKLVIVLDDVHALRKDGAIPSEIHTLLGQLLNIQIEGKISLVLLVSDYQTVDIIKQSTSISIFTSIN